MHQPILTVALTKTQSAQNEDPRFPEREAANAPRFASHAEPFLVVRLMAAVYQREPITVLQGGHPVAQIGRGCCLVAHPRPFDPGGALTPECRSFLLTAVQNAVTATRFRMCVVWAADDCTFVELDGSLITKDDPPSGGFLVPGRITFEQRRLGAGVLPFASLQEDATVQ